MNLKIAAAFCTLLALGMPASAHRLDEYLQATTISLEKDCVQAQIRLTPGVAVFPRVFTNIDTNADGVLSKSEQKAYAEQALRDLSLTMDGTRLKLRLVSWKFAKTGEMKEGRGDIQLDFKAATPGNGPNRKLVFENHHQSRIAVYLVNCLVPQNPNIQIHAQRRNYLQSRYELDYAQAGVPSRSLPAAGWSGAWGWPVMVALLVCGAFAWRWRHVRAGKNLIAQKEEVSNRATVSPEGRGI